MRPRPIAIDLFAGAGGLTLGFKSAGFLVAQAVERDLHATATYRHNHETVDVLQKDIRELDPAACLQRLGLRPGDVTALIAGLPCQGFSESNRRTRTLCNPRNHFYTEFLRFLGVIQPDWFVIENVAGLRTLGGGAILRKIVDGCAALGYESKWRELNAVHYGIPQVRRRLFIVGNRLRLPIRFPKASHGPDLLPFVNVRDAIDDLPDLDNGASQDLLTYARSRPNLTDFQSAMRLRSIDSETVQGNLVSRNSDHVVARYHHISMGNNWQAIPEELLTNYADVSKCHTGIYYRLEWDKPSCVIGNFRKNMLVHPSRHRGLSVREAARLQSFPDDYVFKGSIGFQQQQVADAVPPRLAEAVARQILGDLRRFKRGEPSS